MRISDWSSDVCSSDLPLQGRGPVLVEGAVAGRPVGLGLPPLPAATLPASHASTPDQIGQNGETERPEHDESEHHQADPCRLADVVEPFHDAHADRSEEHTSELQSLMRISYAVFFLNKKQQKPTQHKN